MDQSSPIYYKKWAFLILNLAPLYVFKIQILDLGKRGHPEQFGTYSAHAIEATAFYDQFYIILFSKFMSGCESISVTY